MSSTNEINPSDVFLILEMGRGHESKHWAVSRTGREEGMDSPLKISVEISPVDTFTSDLFFF